VHKKEDDTNQADNTNIMAGGKKDPINELSQKMLAGWTLLAESCSLGCNVPLVENKKQNKIVCVSCDRQFKRDPNEGNDIKPLAEEVSYVTINNGESGHNNKEMWDEEADYEGYSNPSDEELIKQERRRRNDKASVDIGVKLLAGWTMLDLHCPNPSCRTVLMKDKQNQKWCLSCGTMVVTQEEFDGTKHINLSATPFTKVEPNHPQQPPTLPQMQSPQVKSVNTVGQAIQQSNQPHLHQHIPPLFAQPITYPTQNQIIENTLQTLYQKLNEYTRILSITTNLEQSKGLCAVIRECTLAISALHNIR